MPERFGVDMIVQAVTKGFDLVAGDFKKVDDSSKRMERGLKGASTQFTEMQSKIATLQMTVRQFQKVFEFAEQGAQVEQMGISWDFLIAKMGASPDLLEQLRVASGQTISDFELMSNTATLLAGASEQLAPALASATPELLEIAKAANKLNPSLGDTSFMYESIARGVKRASPLILDNLGLMIKVGQANETYAAAMGKSVDALTAEEKQIALLNETLRAGKVLLDQVGGSTESATDKYQKFRTLIKNFTDDMKVMSSEGLEPLMDRMTEQLQIGEDWRRDLEDLGYTMDLVGNIFDDAGNQIGTIFSELDPEMIHQMAEGVREAGDAAYETYLGYKQYADGIRLAEEATGDLDEETEKLDLKEPWEEGIVGVEAHAKKMAAYFLFMELEGPKFKARMDEIARLEEMDLLSEEQARQALAPLLIEYERITAEVEGKPFDLTETQTNVADQIHVPLETVKELWIEAERLLSEGVTIPILFKITTVGGVPGGGGGEIGRWTRQQLGIVTAVGRGERVRQRGGYLQGWDLVGDPGPFAELITPWGYVIDADTTKKLLEAGMMPEQELQRGGRPSGRFTKPAWAWPDIQTTLSGGGGGGGGGGARESRDVSLVREAADVSLVAPDIAESVSMAMGSQVVDLAAGQQQQVLNLVRNQDKNAGKQLELLSEIRDAVEEIGDPVENAQALGGELDRIMP